jgi:rod shape determining protein RodA
MLIFWQAVINLFMILGFLPVVGIPLPLFSYGGSSLLTTLAAIGLLMNIRMRRFQTK